MQRRATRLENPPPGPRCPACWHALRPPPLLTADVCPRCFALHVHLATGRLQRLAPSDLTRLDRQYRQTLLDRQMLFIGNAARRWRSTLRPGP